MAGNEYTDFYHFNWEVVIGHRAGKKSKLIKVAILLVILGVLTLFLKLLNDFLQLSTYEFFWFMFFFAVLFVGVIGVFWQQFSSEIASVTIQRYKISRDGLEINNKIINFSEFDKAKVAPVVGAGAEELKETLDTYFVELPLKRGKIKVHFSNQNEAKRFFKALSYYVKI